MKTNLASVWGVGACAVLTASLVAACVGDTATSTDPASASAGPDAQTRDPERDAAIATPDAGEEQEGGGLLPLDPDAGIDMDAAIDAGPACATVVPGGYSETTCSARAVTMAGGPLSTATYQLSSVTVVGSTTFCASEFVPYEHRGGLRVTATSDTTATLELFDLYRKPSLPPVTPSSLRYDAKVVASGNQLTFTAAPCAQKPAPPSAPYSATTASGKKVLVLRLPYGAGSALYRFVEP